MWAVDVESRQGIIRDRKTLALTSDHAQRTNPILTHTTPHTRIKIPKKCHTY